MSGSAVTLTLTQLVDTHFSKGRIAVIDDDAVFVELMRDLLVDGEGYEVLAPHWLHSVDFIRDSGADLIILDLMLGRAQTGLSILELLREDPLLAPIPVILCSAAAPALRQCESMGARALEVLAKPFDVDDLLAVVERLLAQRRAAVVI